MERHYLLPMNSDRAPLVLFVCTGNQIRSPLSAAIFRRRLSESGLQDRYRVESAGTWTPSGQFDPFARITALQMGLDIEEHRSRLIDRDILMEACLVVVMETGQKEALEVEYPQVRGKVYLLSRLAGEPPYNIIDPAGQGLEHYLQTGEELLRLMNLAFDKICFYLRKC
jgi:protein-tyrosine-phosphatase